MTLYNNNFDRRQQRVRIELKKKNSRKLPRLSIFKSNSNIYAQIIDDINHCTLASVSTIETAVLEKLQVVGRKQSANINDATIIGALIAQKALEKGITDVIFDRGGYKYHGKVKALADAAREAGLKF